jgi:hypothetical protein
MVLGRLWYRERPRVPHPPIILGRRRVQKDEKKEKEQKDNLLPSFEREKAPAEDHFFHK